VGDGEGIVDRAVPAHDDLEVALDEEGRTRAALGQHQGGREFVLGQGHAIGFGDAQACPLTQGLAAGRAVQVEASGEADLATPDLAVPPADGLEEVGRRGQGIRYRGPEVLSAVAVLVQGIALEGAGHELHLSHGAGPGAAHGVSSDMPRLQDGQGLQQFAPEEFSAPALIGQGGQGTRDGVVAQVAAEVGFQPPEGDEYGGRHPVLVFQLLEKLAMVDQELAADLDAAFVDAPVQVVPEGVDEFRLALVEFDDLLDGFGPTQGGVQGGGGNTPVHGLLAQVGQPGLEIGGKGVGSGGGSHQCGCREGRQDALQHGG